MFAGPTTLLVVLMAGLLVAAGMLLAWGAGRPRARRVRRCGAPACGHENPPEARYCGRCGHELE